MPDAQQANRTPPIRYGMVGGGEGAFIGGVHRMAAALDGQWSLVCGAFSADPARAARSGRALAIPDSRIYASLDALLSAERALPEQERMEVLAIVTPNHLHAPAAIAALEAGFHVLSEKPMALNLKEAVQIAEAVKRSGNHYALAFTYSAYPLIAEARMRVARGDFGAIRLVNVAYSQGWLSTAVDNEGNKQAEWRTDPARAGLGGCLGDIGTHAFQLAEHICGLQVEAVSADIATHVPGRRLDDDAAALLRFTSGARGTLRASQIAAGDENALSITIHGTKGGLEWHQMEPNTLTLRWLDKPVQILRAGGPGLLIETLGLQRTPAGHPEGYIEAFASLYRSFACTIRNDGSAAGEKTVFPGIADGLRSMAFVEAVIANAKGDAKWTPLADTAPFLQPL